MLQKLSAKMSFTLFCILSKYKLKACKVKSNIYCRFCNVVNHLLILIKLRVMRMTEEHACAAIWRMNVQFL